MMKLFRCIPFRRANRRMAQEQNVGDAVDDLSNKLSYLSVSTKSNIKYRPMPDPLSVYVPLSSLTEETIHSIVSTVQRSRGKMWNNGRRTLLAFLLAINNRLNELKMKKKMQTRNSMNKLFNMRQKFDNGLSRKIPRRISKNWIGLNFEKGIRRC
jgi:hypothetical protein